MPSQGIGYLLNNFFFQLEDQCFPIPKIGCKNVKTEVQHFGLETSQVLKFFLKFSWRRKTIQILYTPKIKIQ